jgi:hypothetical protein
LNYPIRTAPKGAVFFVEIFGRFCSGLPQIRKFLILGFVALLGGFQDFCLLPLFRSAWFFATNGRIFFLCFEGFSSLLFSLD